VKPIIETERLLVRELVEDDAEAFHALNSDPDVMRYTGEPLSESVEQARLRLRAYPDYRERGYGRWALALKADGHVVGFNGLKYLPELGETDLGFRLRTEFWGQGLATESSLSIVRYGFETLGLERIVGLVLPQNVASIRVLEKVGMRLSGNIDYFGDRVQRWTIDA